MGGTELYEIARRDGAVRLAGELRMADAADIWRSLRSHVEAQRAGRLDLDLSDARVVDGAVMSLLVELRAELALRGVASTIVGADEHVRPLVHLYGGDLPPRPLPEEPAVTVRALLERSVGAAADRTSRAIAFMGELSHGVAGVVRRPVTSNWRSVLPLTERAGADGVVIVALLNFLVGIVMAYQSAKELKIYGANIYVADVVGISVTRELSPLMTAIIMSGRSGAAYAAELGTMKVSEEIDALRTLGFSPMRALVLPRIVALALVAPVLTLLGDVVGVAGGAVVGSATLGVTAAGYLAELKTAVVVSDVWSGLVKSVVFGIVVAHIGCQQGFATRGGAEGVGQRTTTTVVICLFAIVILDTLLTTFFRMFES
jgi:phospholipid/cholesterol/gamma-HCH transport system permease protein